MKRKRIIIGNWKMNPTSVVEAKKTFSAVKRPASKFRWVQTVITPPYVYIHELNKLVTGHRCVIGSQDVFLEVKGSYTGQISAPMLESVGVKYAILGHSEKRALGESSSEVNAKVKLCLKYNIIPVVCIGESNRDDMEYYKFIENQLRESLSGLNRSQLKSVVIAYEPVWAIGKSAERDATPEEITEMSIFLRKILSTNLGSKSAQELNILYGGSVNEKNAEKILMAGGIDGLLIGRASLDIVKFNQILKTAQEL